MRTRPALRSNPFLLVGGGTAGAEGGNRLAGTAIAGTRESMEFFAPAGGPDEDMQVGAAFASGLDPDGQISFWDSQSGSLSTSRVEGDRVKCTLRESPDIGDALKPLSHFPKGRIEARARAMFALAHEVRPCKLRHAFLNRSDGRVAERNSRPSSANNQDRRIYGAVKKREFSWNFTI